MNPVLGDLQPVETAKTSRKIREKINEDRRCTIDEIVEATGVSWNSVRRISTEDSGMRRLSAKFVSRLLAEDQRNARLPVCQDSIMQLESDPDSFSKVKTGDSSWCHCYDPETKQASNQWRTSHTPRPKKARQNAPN